MSFKEEEAKQEIRREAHLLMSLGKKLKAEGERLAEEANEIETADAYADARDDAECCAEYTREQLYAVTPKPARNIMLGVLVIGAVLWLVAVLADIFCDSAKVTADTVFLDILLGYIYYKYIMENLRAR